MSTAVDRSIIAAFRGDFDEAEALLDRAVARRRPRPPEFAYMGHHLRWALLLLRGRFAGSMSCWARWRERDHPYLELLHCDHRAGAGRRRAGAAATLAGVARPARRTRATCPAWLRLRAQMAAATGDPELERSARAALEPHRGEWLVSLFGCDISGPVEHWLALVDAAQGRWDDAVARLRDGAARPPTG